MLSAPTLVDATPLSPDPVLPVLLALSALALVDTKPLSPAPMLMVRLRVANSGSTFFAAAWAFTLSLPARATAFSLLLLRTFAAIAASRFARLLTRCPANSVPRRTPRAAPLPKSTPPEKKLLPVKDEPPPVLPIVTPPMLTPLPLRPPPELMLPILPPMPTTAPSVALVGPWAASAAVAAASGPAAAVAARAGATGAGGPAAPQARVP